VEAFASCSGWWLSRKAQKVNVVGLLTRRYAEFEDVHPRTMESITRGNSFQGYFLSGKILIAMISGSIEI
jgi:hypothetical protein